MVRCLSFLSHFDASDCGTLPYSSQRDFSILSMHLHQKDPGNETDSQKTVKNGILSGTISCVSDINS